MKFRVELDVEIKRPVREVFDFLADVENNPKWAAEFVEVEKITDGPIGRGTTFRMILNPPTNARGVLRGKEEQRSKGPHIETTTRWLEYQELRRLVSDSPPIKRGPATIDTTQTFVFEAPDDETTRLTVSWDREVRDVPFQRLAQPIMTRLIPKEIRKAQELNLQRLKDLLESRDLAPTPAG